LIGGGKGSMWYVHKFSDTYWYIKKYNPASSIIDIIVETPGKTEDFAIANDGTFFMGFDAKLYSYHPDRQTSWKEVADLSIYGISRISRLTLSQDGNQLALVSERIMSRLFFSSLVSLFLQGAFQFQKNRAAGRIQARFSPIPGHR
jgi:hypothetical protein